MLLVGVMLDPAVRELSWGAGGMLEAHAAERARLAKLWNTSEKATDMTAWGAPKAERARMVQGILQLPIALILFSQQRLVPAHLLLCRNVVFPFFPAQNLAATGIASIPDLKQFSRAVAILIGAVATSLWALSVCQAPDRV